VRLLLSIFVASFAPALVSGRIADTAVTREENGPASFLAAVAAVENAPHGKRGKRGETGPWQLMPGTRRDRARELAARGVTRPTERQLAEAHFVWLRRELARRGVAPLTFNMALAWNAGAAATAEGRAPEASYYYARRVCNLMEAAP